MSMTMTCRNLWTTSSQQHSWTEAQKLALRSLLEDLHKRYPKALIVGHCDLDPRKPHCPGFKFNEYVKVCSTSFHP